MRHTLLGLLNADNISIMYSLLQVIKTRKIRSCHLQVGMRLLYAMSGKGEEFGMRETEEAVVRRAQAIKLKGIRARKLEITEHELLE